MKILLFILKSYKYKLTNFYYRLKAFLKWDLFLAEGTYILYPQNISIGKNPAIGPFCQLICQDPGHGSSITIGDNVSFNHHVFINADGGGKITIGNDVMIGPMTILRAANHNFKDPMIPIRDQGHTGGHICIEDDVWLGASVVVLANVTIGKSSVIGAGSVVTKNIPPYSVAVGNPTKVIRTRK